MLAELIIQDYVIIDKLQLTLQSGMTVITGETGAGKSIIIDALELALGKRADNQCIANAKPYCDISVLFDISHINSAKRWLTKTDLFDPDNPDYCLLRRRIYRDNPSRAYINGQMTTLNQLRELGSLLMTIHGQHAHQLLLKPQHQRELLDSFGQHQTLCQQVNHAFETWKDNQTQLDHLLAKTGDNVDDKKAYLQYQLDELNELALKPGETDQLTQQIKQGSQQAQLQLDLQNAFLYLDQNPESASGQLAKAKQALATHHDLFPELKSILDLLDQAHIHTRETLTSLTDFQQTQIHDPNQLQQAEQRLSLIYTLARKHRCESDELLQVANTLKAELHSLETIDHDITKLKIQLAQHEKDYNQFANQLTNARKKASEHLSQQITQHMQTLSMKGGQFCVTLITGSHQTPNAHGNESCEFHVSANVGQAPQPLSKVASGGELSRISLAIQLITAQIDNAQTLLFDEVDVGIGGATAAIAGQSLKQLSKRAQVICITHLPQVAACGDHHLSVVKQHGKTKTQSQLVSLDHHERIDEIARMLGGLEITKQTRSHAEELLSQSGELTLDPS